jgi:hypothetical protein
VLSDDVSEYVVCFLFSFLSLFFSIIYEVMSFSKTRCFLYNVAPVRAIVV